MCRSTTCLLAVAVVVAGLAVVFERGLRPEARAFDQEVIAAIAARATKAYGADPASVEAMFANVTRELRAAYPTLISPAGVGVPDRGCEFIFINAGGWMGSYCLLHASLTEYVLFFGTAIPTSGHSGRYFATIYDTLLTGTFRQWDEGTTATIAYAPGDTIVHPLFAATGVAWTEQTWMVEYAHGIIPSTIFFALADAFTSTLDVVTVGKSLATYGQMVTSQLLSGKI